MRVETMRRYPVKSMLGERIEHALLDVTGLEADRRWGLLDDDTGLVATAKHPRRWRRLLQYAAALHDGRVRVSTPTGRTLDVDDPSLLDELIADLGRPVHFSARRPSGSSVERSDPEEVLERGVEAEVGSPTLEIAQGTPGETFVDHSPVHVITTATLDRLDVDPARYRPNLVVSSDGAPFAENHWVGRELQVGDVVLRVTLPTPRCSVPTLEHGDLARAPEAVRPLMTDNRVDVPGFGTLPCAGVYAQVLRGGPVGLGDRVTVA